MIYMQMYLKDKDQYIEMYTHTHTPIHSSLCTHLHDNRPASFSASNHNS